MESSTSAASIGERIVSRHGDPATERTSSDDDSNPVFRFVRQNSDAKIEEPGHSETKTGPSQSEDEEFLINGAPEQCEEDVGPHASALRPQRPYGTRKTTPKKKMIAPRQRQQNTRRSSLEPCDSKSSEQSSIKVPKLRRPIEGAIPAEKGSELVELVVNLSSIPDTTSPVRAPVSSELGRPAEQPHPSGTGSIFDIPAEYYEDNWRQVFTAEPTSSFSACDTSLGTESDALNATEMSFAQGQSPGSDRGSPSNSGIVFGLEQQNSEMATTQPDIQAPLAEDEQAQRKEIASTEAQPVSPQMIAYDLSMNYPNNQPVTRKSVRRNIAQKEKGPTTRKKAAKVVLMDAGTQVSARMISQSTRARNSQNKSNDLEDCGGSRKELPKKRLPKKAIAFGTEPDLIEPPTSPQTFDANEPAVDNDDVGNSCTIPNVMSPTRACSSSEPGIEPNADNDFAIPNATSPMPPEQLSGPTTFSGSFENVIPNATSPIQAHPSSEPGMERGAEDNFSILGAISSLPASPLSEHGLHTDLHNADGMSSCIYDSPPENGQDNCGASRAKIPRPNGRNNDRPSLMAFIKESSAEMASTAAFPCPNEKNDDHPPPTMVVNKPGPSTSMQGPRMGPTMNEEGSKNSSTHQCLSLITESNASGVMIDVPISTGLANQPLTLRLTNQMFLDGCEVTLQLCGRNITVSRNKNVPAGALKRKQEKKRPLSGKTSRTMTKNKTTSKSKNQKKSKTSMKKLKSKRNKKGRAALYSTSSDTSSSGCPRCTQKYTYCTDSDDSSSCSDRE